MLLPHGRSLLSQMVCSLVRWSAVLLLCVSTASACGGSPNKGSYVACADVDAGNSASSLGTRPENFDAQIQEALTAESWDRHAFERIAAEIAKDFQRDLEPQSFSELVARAQLLHILTELHRDQEDRQPSVETGLKVASELSARFPDHVESSYYTAIFLGRQAQNQGLSALATVKKVEKLALAAVDKDPTFDAAGPLRFLAMLYLNAPAWPVSIGDIDRAREFAVEAVETADVPTNWIVLAGILAEDGEKEKAKSLLENALAAQGDPYWKRAKIIWEPRARELLRRIQ